MEFEDTLRGLRIYFIRQSDSTPWLDFDFTDNYQVYKSYLSRLKVKGNQRVKVYFDNLDNGNCETELSEQSYDLMISQIDYKGVTLKVKIENETETTWKCKRCSLINDILSDECILGCAKPQ